MYQFTEIFGEMQSGQRKNYRWRGLALGTLLGWLPAWGVLHWSGLSHWFFPLFWILTIAIAYGAGYAIKK